MSQSACADAAGVAEDRDDDGRQSLTDLLDRIEARSRQSDRITVQDMMKALQARGFAPLLLVPGLIALGPVGAIPGMSLFTGSIIFLVSIQILLGRNHPWLPEKALGFQIPSRRLSKLIGYSRRPARFIDRFLKPRLTWFAEGLPGRLGSAMCVAMALTMFPLALVPWGVMLPAGSVSAYALGLATRDGALVLAANVLGLGALGLTAWFLTTL
ncbi:MAG: exopolysaccharide biosynthesis protein [Minwuia sp.]|uniref:exopolysaccharide biosynthesis protein n=1 Tax=Minwuia sp. TaxID=2493630 RepID=UPI003A8667FC